MSAVALLPSDIASRAFKAAEAIQSFVIDEVALAVLLEEAWKPIGKKLIKQMSAAIDFDKYTFSVSDGLNTDLWLEDTMYDETAKQVWGKIEKQAKKLLGKSYDRGIEEEGKDPFTEGKKKSSKVQKSVSSVFAERKAEAIAILNKMLSDSFVQYASGYAIPAARTAICELTQLDRLKRDVAEQGKLLADAREIERYELERKLRVTALQNAQQDIIDSLKKQLAELRKSEMIANLSTARAHHFGFLDWAQENGIEYYKISAVLDAKTCAACAAMDGRIFQVQVAVDYKDRFMEIQGDADKIKAEMPFLTKDAAADIVKDMLVGNGQTGDVFYFPPFHPGCRCTVVAVMSEDAPVTTPYSPEDSNYMPMNGIIYTESTLPFAINSQNVTVSLDDIGTDNAATVLTELQGIDSLCAQNLTNLVGSGILSRMKTVSAEVGTAENGLLHSLAWSYDNGSGIVVNTTYFSDMKKLEQIVLTNADNGTFAKVGVLNPVRYVLSHEYGHQIYAGLSSKQKRVLNDLFAKMQDSGMSVVAAQSANEAFAEAFAEYGVTGFDLSAMSPGAVAIITKVKSF